MEFWFSFEEDTKPPLFDSKIINEKFNSKESVFLGRGTFGETWRINKYSGTTAVKIIYNKNFPRHRLEREVVALNRGIESDNIAKLISYNELVLGSDSFPYLEFEFISGGSLASHLKKGIWPNYTQILEYTKKMLTGLFILHNNGVIHRDIKPENIILRNGKFEDPVILDLGIARILDLPALTIYPSIWGTIPYMAPEQIKEERAMKGSDLWSLGIILFILVTHHHPFYGDYNHRLNELEALDRIYSGLPNLPDDIPQILADLITRFLQPDIYKRGSCKRALSEMEAWLNEY